MNADGARPPPPKSPSAPAGPASGRPTPPRREPMRRDDQEFLPSALEILERPASPIAMGMLVSICALLAAALAWSIIGKTEIVAVAQGKIQPSGRVKTVQPIETGRVRGIHATNGQHTMEGESLIELEPGDALAEADQLKAALVSARAEAARREAAIAAAGLQTAPTIAWPPDIPAIARQREEAVLMADLRNLTAQLVANDAQRDGKEAERARLAATIVAQEALIGTLRERVDMRQALVTSAAGTKSSLIDAEETLRYQLTFLATEKGQLVEAERGLQALAAERDKLLNAFLAENVGKRADALRQVAELTPRVAKAQIRIDNLILRSPASGTVQASSVTSIGQVLNAGMEVMRIVPDGAELEVEVYLPNKDIGFVRAGQPASVKLETFPFTRYGTIDATVVRVAVDAIPQPDAASVEGDPSRALEPRGPTGTQRVQNLVYPVTLSLARTDIDADDRRVPLEPGMAATAEIKTGQRRLIDYVLSPLTEFVSQAARER